MNVRHLSCSSIGFQTVGAAIVLLFIAITVVLSFPDARCQQSPIPKMTLSQVQDLIAHKVPDSTMSAQLQRRGLAFTPSPAIVESLRAKGAGPLTLSAVQALIPWVDPNAPKPKLTLARVEQGLRTPGSAADESLAAAIKSRGVDFTVRLGTFDALYTMGKSSKPRSLAALHELLYVGKGKVEGATEPGAHLFLDGNETGSAGINGSFAFQDVDEGNHELIARGEGYRDASSKFSLGDNEDKRLSLPMEWLGGFITVSAQPENAKIFIPPTIITGSARDNKLQPGNYTATVSADGYLTQTRNFTVGAGEHHVEQFQLAIDPAAAGLKRAGDLANLREKADSGDAASVELLRQALARGEQIGCEVKTAGVDYAVGAAMYDGTLTISKSSISFRTKETGGHNYYHPNFTVVPAKILEVTNQPEQVSSIRLKVAILNKNGTKEDKKTFLLYNHGAEFVTMGSSGPNNLVRISCNSCDNSINVLYALLQESRGSK